MIARLFHQYYQHHGTVITRLLLLAGLAAAAGAIAIAGRPHAAIICLPVAEARAQALARFGEVAAFGGENDMAYGGGQMIVTLNPKTQSWTVFLIVQNNIACAMLSGDGWELAPPEVTGQPVPKPQQYLRPDADGRLRYFIPIGFR